MQHLHLHDPTDNFNPFKAFYLKENEIKLIMLFFTGFSPVFMFKKTSHEPKILKWVNLVMMLRFGF